jgi:hypothetical protein
VWCLWPQPQWRGPIERMVGTLRSSRETAWAYAMIRSMIAMHRRLTELSPRFEHSTNAKIFFDGSRLRVRPTIA